jgi:hypothetical protein
VFEWFRSGKAKVLDRSPELEAKILALEKERSGLKEEVEDLKIKRKVEDEQLKHLLKIKEEKMDLEFQKKEVALEAKKAAEVATVKDNYRDKMEAELKSRHGQLQEMYNQILKRLPDVNVALTGKVR